MDLHFTHGQLGVQPLQALPGKPLAIEPERSLRQAGLDFHQQVRVIALVETVLISLEFVRRHPTQLRDLLGVALGHGVNGQPGQRTIEAQGPNVGCFLLEPPGA
ncbi:hypothetical protein D3C76_1194180 [compost metagenome]